MASRLLLREMTQALYAHMNNKIIIKKKERQVGGWLQDYY
jgi:hypothetical protein